MTTDFPSNNNIHNNAKHVGRKHDQKDNKKSGSEEKHSAESNVENTPPSHAQVPANQVFEALKAASVNQAVSIQQGAAIANTISRMNKVLNQYESTIREEFPDLSQKAVKELALMAINRRMDQQQP